MVNNPYIDLVKEHPHIIYDTEKIYKNKSCWKKFFKQPHDITLEIGTGLGNFFSREVLKNSDQNFVWMEIKYKRLYICAEKALWNLSNYAGSTRPKHVIKRVEKQTTQNITQTSDNNFILLKDFWENIDKIFWKNEISLSYIFFPDPWARKKRWLKNRLLQEHFLNNLYTITKNWWKSIIKTDHLDYFEFILEEVWKTQWKIHRKSYDWEKENEFSNTETTEFQQLFRGKKIQINYLELEKQELTL